MDTAYCTECGTRRGDPWTPPDTGVFDTLRREVVFEVRDLGRVMELVLPGVEATWSCSRCGTVVATEQAYCGRCGQDLSERRYREHARTESRSDSAGVALLFLLVYAAGLFAALAWAGPRGGLADHFALVMGGPILAAAIFTVLASHVLR